MTYIKSHHAYTLYPGDSPDALHRSLPELAADWEFKCQFEKSGLRPGLYHASRVHSILSNISVTIICDADYVAISVSAVLRATTCSKFEFLAMRDGAQGISTVADIA